MRTDGWTIEGLKLALMKDKSGLKDGGMKGYVNGWMGDKWSMTSLPAVHQNQAVEVIQSIKASVCDCS